METADHCCDNEEVLQLSTGKICRLFGADITQIDHHSNHESATSYDMVTHVDMETKKQQNFMLFGVYIYHNDSCDVTSSRETQDVGETKSPSSRKRKSRNSNLILQEADLVPPPPSIILEQELALLFEKKLTASDVCPGQNRMLIPKSDSRQLNLIRALKEEEKEKVLLNKTDFLSVLTTDRDDVEYTLHLNLWTSSNAIVLTHQWSKLVAANGLKEGDWVQVWGRRVQPHGYLRLQILKKFN